MARRSRFGLVALGALTLVVFLYLTLVGGGSEGVPEIKTKTNGISQSAASRAQALAAAEASASASASTSGAPLLVEADAPRTAMLPDDLLRGGAIAPKLGNETAKQELGRASWRLLHTMMARFPEKPTADESLALRSFVQLFARLYPCGECAAHFQTLLAAYPPQTSGRNAAAGWACFVHNEVNTRLEKPLFDCNAIGDFYDCGCGEEKEGEEKEGGEKGEGKKMKVSETVLQKDAAPLALEREEGLSRGG